jgi:hypothetical protein
MATTVLGEEFDPVVEADVLYLQLINILHRNPDFESALTAGVLTDEAKNAIAGAFDEVLERNRRIANILLADKESMAAFTAFWFARSYAEVQASAVYGKAFREAARAS